MFRLGHIAVASAVLSGLLVFAEAASHGAVAEGAATGKVMAETARKTEEIEASTDTQASQADSSCRPAIRVVYAGANVGQRPCSVR